MRGILLALCAALHVHAWSIKDRGAGIDSVETTFQTRLKGGGKGVTLTYVLAACGDEVGELEEDVREDEGAKYLDATELHAAAFGGRADCCEKLVARGDAVDAKLNTTNWTPMHVAAQGGNAAVVEYLLGQGADPNAAGVDPTPDRPPNQVGPAPDGFTALHAAVRAGSCVEINQCVGCTIKITESFLGDDVAALAPSSGEEPTSPRHRAGIASMAWRTTRRFSTNAP